MDYTVITIIISAITGIGTLALSFYTGTHGVIMDDLKEIKQEKTELEKENADLRKKVDNLSNQIDDLNKQYNDLYKKYYSRGN